LKYCNTQKDNHPEILNTYVADAIDKTGTDSPQQVKDAITAFLNFFYENKPSDDDEMKDILTKAVDKDFAQRYKDQGIK
jgi:hypothetical protein